MSVMHVAHAEDAVGHPIGVERLELVELLAGAAKRIGLPTTSFTDSAAPPRASPSILVRITPSRPTGSSNARSATFTAS